MTEPKTWYVRRHEQIKGPFALTILAKLARIGRLKPTDYLSDNRHDWSLASEHTELFEHNDKEISLKDEERSGLDRRVERKSELPDEVFPLEKPHQADRRKPESEESLRRRRGRARLLKEMRENRSDVYFPRFAIGIAVLLIILLGIVMNQSGEQFLPEPDCNVLPQPKVNWNNCEFKTLRAKQSDLTHSMLRNAKLIKADLQASKMVSSDLSYSNLSGSNLARVQMDNATLKGTNLHSANLRSASLRQADLSYADLRNANLKDADLTQALLHNAIWTDGRLCKKGSVGRCL